MWFGLYLSSNLSLLFVDSGSLVDSRVEDSESVDSKSGFFPKIRALWIQANIFFLLCITLLVGDDVLIFYLYFSKKNILSFNFRLFNLIIYYYKYSQVSI
ncbi:unnamed protein product [Spirodela intermedia]|uniref:Uncharacterized protein n=1 Tax=Spirodela intermedia TaxID=51605 RepID=A0A7I8JQM5_SPIIN|nr:unnamed protein product [Spirodela intermedia]CAA6672071.1 unnamed protein product [Spirodela intermedia]